MDEKESVLVSGFSASTAAAAATIIFQTGNRLGVARESVHRALLILKLCGERGAAWEVRHHHHFQAALWMGYKFSEGGVRLLASHVVPPHDTRALIRAESDLCRALRFSVGAGGLTCPEMLGKLKQARLLPLVPVLQLDRATLDKYNASCPVLAEATLLCEVALAHMWARWDADYTCVVVLTLIRAQMYADPFPSGRIAIFKDGTAGLVLAVSDRVARARRLRLRGTRDVSDVPWDALRVPTGEKVTRSAALLVRIFHSLPEPNDLWSAEEMEALRDLRSPEDPFSSDSSGEEWVEGFSDSSEDEAASDLCEIDLA